MTIPKLTPYTGQVANPDGSQTQSEFTQNMFDQLSYEANLATELDATIDGINNAVDEVEANSISAEKSANAAEAAASSAGYKGLWPDTGGGALKGETYQTQVGGTPTGEYYTALQNTSVDPVGDNVNWRKTSLSKTSILEVLGEINKGFWDEDPLLETERDFVVERATGNTFGAISLPYQVNSTANPDPSSLVPSELRDVSNFVDEEQLNNAIEDFVPEFDLFSELLAANIPVGGFANLKKSKWKRTSDSSNDVTDFEQLTPASPEEFGITGSKTSCVEIMNLISQGVEFEVPELLYTTSYAFSQWEAGNKFPVAFFGDSTTDGAGSTTNGTDEATIFNVNSLVSGLVPDGFNHDHDESEVPNAYPSILQRMVRDYTGNSTMRLYNAGYRGQLLYDGWAQENIHNAIYANPSYSDCKMVAINFGLNDSGVSADNLIRETILRTESIILDAYNRGVQPFLMTCSMSGRAGGAKYNTAYINLTIDNAKRQLADKYGIPCIEIADFFTRYISENNDFVSYQDLTFDDLHYSDLGYLKQSEFMFKYFAGGVAVQDVSDEIGIDYTSPCMRLNGIPFSRISSTTTISRGVSQRLRNIVCERNDLDEIKGTSFVNAWIWNENPNRFVVYSNYTDQASDGSALTSLDNAVSISATSRDYLVGTNSNEFSMPDPDAYGSNFSTTYRIETPVKMRRLEYGLNYLKISVPESLESNYLSSKNYFGPFYFTNITENTPIVSYDNFTGGVVGFIESDCFIDAVSSRNLPVLENNQRYFEPENGLNFGGVPNVGDVFEIMIDADVPAGAGVVIGYNRFDTLSISGLDKSKYVVGGDTWFAFNETNLKIGVRGPTGGTQLDLDMGVTYPTEPYVIKVDRESSTSIKFSAISLNGTVIGSQSTSDPRTLKSWSGLVVGGAIGLGAAGSVKINSMRVR